MDKCSVLCVAALDIEKARNAIFRGQEGSLRINARRKTSLRARVKGAVDKLEGIVPIHCRKKTEFHDRLIIDLI